MQNTSQNTNRNPGQGVKENSAENTEKLNRKIKETWSGLSDSDVKLYSGRPEEFFAKLQERHNVSKEDGQKRIQQLEKDCGCTGAAKAA